MQLRRRNEAPDRGITLIELVVAVFVLALGTVAALRVVDQARLEIGGATARVLAHSVALNRAEAVRLYGPDEAARLPDTVVQGPYRWRVTQRVRQDASGLTRVTIQISTPDAPGALLDVFLPEDPA